jgi:hypothetical protein
MDIQVRTKDELVALKLGFTLHNMMYERFGIL